jgi:HSP20 family molecular chaperone IbpA
MTLLFAQDPVLNEMLGQLLLSQAPLASKKKQHQAPPASPKKPASRPAACCAPASACAKVTLRMPQFTPSHSFDILEHAEHYEFITDAPGLSASDISVDLEDGALIISGKLRMEEPAAADAPKASTSPAPPASPTAQPSEPMAPSSEGSHQEFVVVPEQQEGARAAEQEQQPEQAAAAEPPASPKQPGKASKVLRHERRALRFRRAFELPEDSLEEGIEARLDKGVLTVRVPKKPVAPKPQPKRIHVQQA